MITGQQIQQLRNEAQDNLADEIEKLIAVYVATGRLMAVMGSLIPRHPDVDAVMDALHDVEGARQWDT